MYHFRRILALCLTILMLLPTGGFAEEEAASAQTGQQIDEIITAAETAVEEIPEEAEVEDAETAVGPAIPAEGLPCYVRVTEDAFLYDNDADDAVLALMRAGSIALMTETVGSRAHLYFEYVGAQEHGWVMESSLEALDADAVLAYIEAHLDAVCYENDPAYPLAAPDLTLDLGAAESEELSLTAADTEPGPTEGPVAETVTEPTAEPEENPVDPSAEPEPVEETVVETPEEAGETAQTTQVTALAPKQAWVIMDYSDDVNVADLFDIPDGMSVSYACENNGVLSIVDGKIAPLTLGTAKITASGGSQTAECTVTVQGTIPTPTPEPDPDTPTVASVSIQPSARAFTGITFTPEVTLYDADGAVISGEYSLASSNTGVAEISGQSIVTKNPGQVTITATAADGGATATMQLQVIGICAASVTNTVDRMEVGETHQFGATINSGSGFAFNAETDDPGIATFSSSNESVATVDATGLVTAVAPGTTTIRFTASFGVPISHNLTVTAGVTQVHTRGQMCIFRGVTIELPVTLTSGGQPIQEEYYLTTSNGSVITVSGKNVTAQACGSATVTVSTATGSTGTVSILVANPASGSNVQPSGSIVINEGETAKLNATIWYNFNGSINSMPFDANRDDPGIASFSIDDPNVATITPDGLITGVRAGTTTAHFISAPPYNVDIGGQTITVVHAAQQPTALTMSPEEASLPIGGTQQLTTAFGADDEEGVVTFASSDPSVATVTEEGLVTAVADGTATITASVEGESGTLTATCGITVQKALLITAQPQDLYAEKDDHPAFAIAATGEAVQYQWYYRRAGRTDWILWKGRDSAEAGFLMYDALDGLQAYCKVTDAYGVTVDSQPATVHLAENLVITAQPQDTNALKGARPSFSVEATGGELSWQWYYRKVEASDWTLWKSKTEQTLSFLMYTSFDGMQVFCRVTDAHGRTLDSDPATVTLEQGLVVTLQPQDALAKEGSSVLIRCEASGQNPTYQWYYKKEEASDWTLWQGQTTADLRFRMYESQDGMQVRCEVTDANGESVETDAATVLLNRNVLRGLSVDPAETELMIGEVLEMSVQTDPAALTGVTYSFASSDPTVTSVNEDGDVSALATGTATITATAELDGTQITATCEVTVVESPLHIEVPANLNLFNTRSMVLPVRFVENGRTVTEAYTLTSSNPGMVEVSGNTVTGKSLGSSDITIADSTGLVTATTRVTVVPTPINAYLEPGGSTQNYTTPKQICVGEEFRYNATVYVQGGIALPFNGETDSPGIATFSIADESIATVDGNGLVTGIREGTTQLSWTSSYGMAFTRQVQVLKAPEWLRFDEPVTSLSVDQSRVLNVEMSEGSHTILEYTSSDESVLEVVGNGTSVTLNGKMYGTAVVTAHSSNGLTTSCSVTVMARPESIVFTRDAMEMALHDTVQLPGLRIESSDGVCANEVTYTVGNSNAEVTQTGYITGLQPGAVTVTATTYNGLSAQCTVTVLPEPTSVSVSADAAVAVGDTCLAVATLDSIGEYDWSVTPEERATIDADGTLHALAVGTVTVTATVRCNGISDSFDVEIVDYPRRVNLAAAKLTLGFGADAKPMGAELPEGTIGHIVYSVDDDTIATVDETGSVRGVSEGTARVTASLRGHADVFNFCDVTVLPLASGLALDTADVTMYPGATRALHATLTEGAYPSNVLFESSDEQTATVDASGVVTAVAAGSSTITAKLADDETVSAQCQVTVSDSGWSLSALSLTLGAGDTAALLADAPAALGDPAFETTDAAVATVDSNGQVTAVAEGAASILVTLGGTTKTCAVSVAAAPTDIDLPEEIVLHPGDAWPLEAALTPANAAATLTYASGDEATVTVDENGVVAAQDIGTAVITATTYNDKTASCTARVVREPETIRFAEIDAIVVAVGDTYMVREPVMSNRQGECDDTWSLALADESCASLEQTADGWKLRATAMGETTLMVRADSGASDTCAVRIVAKPSAIVWDHEPLKMAVGEEIEPVILGTNGARMTCTYTSASTSVVRVEDGRLIAVSEGTARVTATAALDAQLKKAVTVHVLAAPESMTLQADRTELGVCERARLSVSFPAGQGTENISYQSSDEGVLRLDGNGNAMAVGAGTATVTARTVNGVQAELTFSVSAAPTELSVRPSILTACLEDAVTLQVSYDEGALSHPDFASADSSVATVNADGEVAFQSVGETVITVTTHNGLTAQVPVRVCETPTVGGFARSSVVILQGDRAPLEVDFDNGAAYYTLTSDDESVAAVMDDGTISAVAAGTATVQLDIPSLSITETCTVQVVEHLDGLVLTSDISEIKPGEQAQLSVTLLPENAIGTGLVTYSSLTPELASVTSDTGLVTGASYGTAMLQATAGDGTTATCEVRVLGGRHRMFIATWFGESGNPGYLPFEWNNGDSLLRAFSEGTAEGRSYEIKGPLSNVRKASFLSQLDSWFAGATDDDVSLIYLSAHGSSSGGYHFWTDPSNSGEYVTANELMDHLENIAGHVVLVMDSCQSGGMIDGTIARLNAQNGRISVLTSSRASTSSCYWDVANKYESVDFYTCAILDALGFNECSGLGNLPRGGWYETSANADGVVTIDEWHSYAHDRTMEFISTAKGSPSFRGDSRQEPMAYISGVNQGLIIFE